MNEGRLDEDTAPAEEPEPADDDQSIMANLDRTIKKMPARTKAMMGRMGGHPYENFDMIPYQVRAVGRWVGAWFRCAAVGAWVASACVCAGALREMRCGAWEALRRLRRAAEAPIHPPAHLVAGLVQPQP